MKIMATKKYLLPSLEQCLALTDEQCHLIMRLRDPEGIRAQKNWELAHQAELIRQYMTMRSFTQIAQIMRSKLEWSYKTYANRYRDWMFPVDRVERELAIMDLYSLVTAGTDAGGTDYSISQLEPPLVFQSNRPRSYLRSQCTYNIQPKQPDSFPITENYSNNPHVHDKANEGIYPEIPVGLAEFSNWSQRPMFDEYTSGQIPMSATTSSTSQFARHSIRSPKTRLQQRKQKNSKSQSHPQDIRKGSSNHNNTKGLWYSALRVIPCKSDHGNQSLEQSVRTCDGCGFSQCHAVMTQAKKIGIRNFRKCLTDLRNHVKIDYAGNHPLSFLMAAGVSMEFFMAVLCDVEWSTFETNSFAQSPLHVLNPMKLGDELTNLLEQFPEHLCLRDSKCRTFLHYLFKYPLNKGSYLRVLKIFPNAAHYLQSFDTSGKLITEYIQEKLSLVRSPSQHFHRSIHNGINEINKFLSGSGVVHSKSRPYGFLEIARGMHGDIGIASDFFLPPPYKCPFCQSTTAHSSSYYDQMDCACKHGGIDRNAPDKEGWTAAHLIVTHFRYNDDLHYIPESPAQTAELFKLLVFSPELREVLHVLDPNGNSLVYNIATRGHTEILKYALELEEKRRRCSMVNSFGRSKRGEKISVLEGVEMAISYCEDRMKRKDGLNDFEERERLDELFSRLVDCHKILKFWGAVKRPSATEQWKINGVWREATPEALPMYF